MPTNPDSKIKTKMKLKEITSLYDIKVPDIVKYVKNLHKYINAQQKRIKKLRLKIKKMKYLSKLDHLKIPDTDEKEEPIVEELPATQDEAEKIENVEDFLNDIKSAANQAVLEQNFIYEPTSGLYYDPRSGYYYNAEYGLYYDGNTGCYYKYDQSTNSFEFHSQVQTANTETNKELDNEEEAIRKILEDGRKPIKSQESNGDKKDKEGTKKCYDRDEYRRRRSDSSDSSDTEKYYRKRYKSRSRSRSRSRGRYRSRSRSRGKDKKRSKSKERRRRSRSGDGKHKEDGELDTSDSNDHSPESERQIMKKRRKKKRKDDYEEIAKKYPPSLRIIVLETSLDDIDVGKLFVVTYKGDSININKAHLKFKYNHKRGLYQVTDLSSSGTILNGVDIGSTTEEEQLFDLLHGSLLELNQTNLLCHVHDGITTCDDCEPYNYIKTSKAEPKPLEAPSLTHKEQLKLLKKRYGLETEKYQDKQAGGQPSKNYVDRAEKRRVKVGSSHDHEKTVQASLDTSISIENKGFKMMSKMGWKGESLGKDNSGIKEPVPLLQNTGTSGLGFETGGAPSVSFNFNDKKQNIWNKAQERYKNLSKNDDDEEED